MAFPVIQATSTYGLVSSDTHNVAVPASQPHDRLLLVVAIIGTATINLPSGWTAVGSQVNGPAPTISCRVFEKIAGDSEPTTVQVTLSASANAGALVWRLSGVRPSAAAANANATGTTTTPDSPNLAPGWGAQDILWITTASHRHGSIASAPTNYTDFISTTSNFLSGASRSLSASSEDPGAWDPAGTSGDWISFTFGLRPGGYVLVCAAGSFALAGQDANFIRALRLDAAVGAFALAGQDANLFRSFPLLADAGAFTVAGQDANFIRALRLTADVGAFALSGQDINFLRALLFGADAGIFALAGQDAQFLRALLFQAETGAFTLTGHDVAFLLMHLVERQFPTYVIENLSEYPAGAKVDLATRILTKGM